MPIRYSPRAARAIARLKQQYNDIDIFVEDTASPNMWLELVRSIIPPSKKIKSVTQLGGRDRVIAACKLDQANDGRPKLYIIDGDFDYLLGRKKPRLNHLYRLRAYCVENILVARDAVRYVGMVAKPTWSEDQIISKFDYRAWLERTEKKLKPLFILYAVTHMISPSVATTSYSVTNLFIETPSGPEICLNKLFTRMLAVSREARAASSLAEFRRSRQAIEVRAQRLGMRETVSGKDYVLPLFSFRLRKLLSVQGSTEQIKVHLARAFKSDQEPWFARRVQGLCA